MTPHTVVWLVGKFKQYAVTENYESACSVAVAVAYLYHIDVSIYAGDKLKSVHRFNGLDCRIHRRKHYGH